MLVNVVAVKKVSTELKEVAFFRNFATVKRGFTVELDEDEAVLLVEGIEREANIIRDLCGCFLGGGLRLRG